MVEHPIFAIGERHIRTLRRELDRSAKRYPDLRLEVFVPRRHLWSMPGLKDVWAAVRHAFSESETEEWVVRKRAFYYRITGKREGIDSLFGLEQEIDLGIGPPGDLPGGNRIPAFALASYLGLTSCIPFLQTRLFRAAVANTASRKPLHWHLAWLSPHHCPFLLMGAALDWMMEPNGLLSVPKSLQAIPKLLLFSAEVKSIIEHIEQGSPRARREPKPMSVKETPGHAKLSRILSLPFAFTQGGKQKQWVFRFTDDEGTEESILSHLDGFDMIRRIMQSRQKPLSVFAVAGLPEKQSTPQPKIDDKTKNEALDRIEDLRQKVESGGELSDDEARELQRLEPYMKEALGVSHVEPDRQRKKRARVVEDNDTKNARNNSRKAITLAKQTIHGDMPRFREYLDEMITFGKGKWSYIDRDPPDWHF